MGIFGNLFKKKSLQGVHSGGGWHSMFIHEPYSGAWQKNDELTREDVTAHHAVFSCVSLSAPKVRKVKKTESQKMKEEIDRIEKRVNEINKNIEDYKAAEIKLDELDEKYSQTMKDLRLE